MNIQQAKVDEIPLVWYKPEGFKRQNSSFGLQVSVETRAQR